MADAGPCDGVVTDALGASVTREIDELEVNPMFIMITGSPVTTNNIGTCTAAWFDYDNDGFLDLFINHSQGKPHPNFLYRNNHREFLAQMGQTNHWLQINLRGTKSNRSGIGAKVRVTATIGGKVARQLRQIGGQTCAPELFAHFGLGNAIRATRVRVEWPSGAIEELSNVPADQGLTLVEPLLRGSMLAGGQFELSVTATRDRVRTLEVSSDLSAVWNRRPAERPGGLSRGCPARA